MALRATIEALMKRNNEEVTGSVTGEAHAETLNALIGTVTTEALSTASAATETRTLTNSNINANSFLLVEIVGGTNTTQGLDITVLCAAGSATIKFYNSSAAAVNGTLIYDFLVL